MPIDRLIDEPIQRPQLFEATFVDDVASHQDEARVLITSFDSAATFGPCPWPSRHDGAGLVLPARGDRALVAFSDDNQPWVVAWWPY